MVYFKLANNAETSLAYDINESETIIKVVNPDVFPTTYPFLLTIWRERRYPDPTDDSEMEVILVTGNDNGSLVATRGYANTTGVSHSANDRVALIFVKEIIDDPTYGLQVAIDGKAESDHDHTESDISDLHQHANKSVIDGITDVGSGIIISDEERTKLESLESNNLSDNEERAISDGKGYPSKLNFFVKNSDSRLRDAREPMRHGNSSHIEDYATSNELQTHIDDDDKHPTTSISSGSGAPSSTPAKIGDEYLDTANLKLYKAFGTSSSSDWVVIN